MQCVMKYFLDDKSGNVSLVGLNELPILGVAKCAWPCIKMIHLLWVPNMLPWRLLVLHIDPQPKPVFALLSQLHWRLLVSHIDPQPEPVFALLSQPPWRLLVSHIDRHPKPVSARVESDP